MKFLVLLALVGFTAAAVTRTNKNEELDSDWEAYKTKHDKNYETDAEELLRRTIWEENLKEIEHHNIRYSLGEITYTLGMNKFGDMTPTEFAAKMNGYKQSELATDNVNYLEPLNIQLPASVDWRTKGYVTGVKDQGACGSCWAFSTTGSLEGQWFRKNGMLIPMSEQNLVDCSFPEGNLGCLGGQMIKAFAYIWLFGIESETSYPYTAKLGWCKYNLNKVVAHDKGWVMIPAGNESALESAIATVGPISIAIDASQKSFQLYAGGVYNEPACSNSTLDHGVLAVGYGTDPTGGDYYIVKNSWGAAWGLKGYILMSRNKNNQCGIATEACYPKV